MAGKLKVAMAAATAVVAPLLLGNTTTGATEARLLAAHNRERAALASRRSAGTRRSPARRAAGPTGSPPPARSRMPPTIRATPRARISGPAPAAATATRRWSTAGRARSASSSPAAFPTTAPPADRRCRPLYPADVARHPRGRLRGRDRHSRGRAGLPLYPGGQLDRRKALLTIRRAVRASPWQSAPARQAAQAGVADWPPGEVVLSVFESLTPTDFRRNPLDCPVGGTCPGTPSAGAGGFTFGDYGRILGGPEVHADGEIWAETLWDLRTAVGSDTAQGLITGGLRLTPPAPTFLQARTRSFSRPRRRAARRSSSRCSRSSPLAAWARTPSRPALPTTHRSRTSPSPPLPHPQRRRAAAATRRTSPGPCSASGSRALDASEVISGGDGSDRITGGGGRDLICGGGGADKINGGGGNDTIIGGGGKDLCKGGKGRDRGSGCERGSQ